LKQKVWPWRLFSSVYSLLVQWRKNWIWLAKSYFHLLTRRGGEI
jgi:hypothetical protein